MRLKNIITISDSSAVTIPSVVSMRDFEIAQLFGIFEQTARVNIKSILKTGAVSSNLCTGGVVSGNSIIPEYFGLDMVVAIAFRVNTYQADIFKKHILSKLTHHSNQNLFIQISESNKDNMVYS